MYKIVITLHQIQASKHRRREISLLTCSQLPTQLLPHSVGSSQPMHLLNPLNISIPCRPELISSEVLWPPMTLVHFFHNLILNVEISVIQRNKSQSRPESKKRASSHELHPLPCPNQPSKSHQSHSQAHSKGSIPSQQSA